MCQESAVALFLIALPHILAQPLANQGWPGAKAVGPESQLALYYIPPPPVNVASCLSALNGLADHHFPLPFDSGIEKIRVVSIEETNNEVQAASRLQNADVFGVAGPFASPAAPPSAPSYAAPEPLPPEPLPPSRAKDRLQAEYTTLSSEIILCILLGAYGGVGLIFFFAPREESLRFFMVAASTFLVGSVALITVYSVLGLPMWVAGLLAVLAASGIYPLLGTYVTDLFGYWVEDCLGDLFFGWLLCVKTGCLIWANLTYELMNIAFAPTLYPYGIVGIFSGPGVVPIGLTYFLIIIIITATYMFVLWNWFPGEIGQAFVVSSFCSYAPIAAAAYLLNLTYNVPNQLPITPLDPVSFFSIKNNFRLSTQLVAFLLLFLLLAVGGTAKQLADFDSAYKDNYDSNDSADDLECTLLRGQDSEGTESNVDDSEIHDLSEVSSENLPDDEALETWLQSMEEEV